MHDGCKNGQHDRLEQRRKKNSTEKKKKNVCTNTSKTKKNTVSKGIRESKRL